MTELISGMKFWNAEVINPNVLLQNLVLVSNMIAYSMMNSLSAYSLGQVISQICARQTSPACDIKLSTVLNWTKIPVKIHLKFPRRIQDTVTVRGIHTDST